VLVVVPYAYISPYHQGDTPFDAEKLKYWAPVDQYTGGIEHATMHLMYTRFFTKALRDIGLVDFDEPMLRLFTQGIILGEDNEKMSKSRGNVVNPDDYVSTLGADAVRAFLMFIGPWELGGSWSSTGIEGSIALSTVCGAWPPKMRRSPQTPRPSKRSPICGASRTKRSSRSQQISHPSSFNTALAALMQFNNYLIKAKATMSTKLRPGAKRFMIWR
jgi:leucyl-tRNA synthetase